MSNAIAIALMLAISLDDAITRAIARSPELRALEASVAEARANASLSNAFRPAASIGTAPGYATGLPTAVLGQVPAIATIEAHRLFYDRSAQAERLAMMSEVDAAMARFESRKRDIAMNVAELYARVAADAKLIASAERRVTAYDTIASRTDALRREGRARDIDVDRAALQLAGAKRTALLAKNRLELDQLRLNQMVGENVEPGDPSLSTQLRMTDDPELKSFDTRIEALQRAVSLEERFFQPTIAAQIQYSRLFDRFRRYYLNFRPDDLSLGATITIPLSTNRAAASARRNAQLQQLIALRDARRMEMDLTRREAETDVAQAGAESEMASRAVAIAQEGLRLAQDLAREGRGEANDVPQAQIALSEAEDELANATAHLATAKARMLFLPHASYNPRDRGVF